MQKIKLKINFMGLCAFVPNTVEGGSMRVLLIDGRAPGLAANGRRHVSHLPSLSFNIDDLDPSVEQPFYYQCGVKERPVNGQWILNGDDLEIRVAGQPLAGNGLSIANNADEYDLSLIPMMINIYPELRGLDVNPVCLKGSDNLASLGLVARLQLQTGTIGAYPGQQCEYLSTEEFTFTGRPDNYRQRLATCAQFETKIDADSVEIHSQQLGQGFKFRPADGKCVELSICNIPPVGLETAKPGDDEADLDFELIYGIASQIPTQLRVPARIAMGPELPQPLLCTSAIYNASEHA